MVLNQFSNNKSPARHCLLWVPATVSACKQVHCVWTGWQRGFPWRVLCPKLSAWCVIGPRREAWLGIARDAWWTIFIMRDAWFNFLSDFRDCWKLFETVWTSWWINGNDTVRLSDAPWIWTSRVQYAGSIGPCYLDRTSWFRLTCQ